MLSSLYTEIYSQERRAALQREAETERLIRLSKAGRGKQPNLYQIALAGLGTRLIHWGIALERMGHTQKTHEYRYQ